MVDKASRQRRQSHKARKRKGDDGARIMAGLKDTKAGRYVVIQPLALAGLAAAGLAATTRAKERDDAQG